MAFANRATQNKLRLNGVWYNISFSECVGSAKTKMTIRKKPVSMRVAAIIINLLWSKIRRGKFASYEVKQWHLLSPPDCAINLGAAGGV
ncbi:MAG: hypothetical protein LBS72_09155 [Oscillospiraceae bacterium]|nr:hypothetical protein [Oscillospiraceae bacterium]